MPDALTFAHGMARMLDTLYREYDGPVPPQLVAAAKYGPRAHERLEAAANMAGKAGDLRYAGMLLKKACRDVRAGRGNPELKAKLLLLCQAHVRTWRRYREEHRRIRREIFGGAT